jgi:hypothetical protein
MARVRLALFALSLVAAPLGAQVNGRTPGLLVPATTATEQVSPVTPVTRGPTLESARLAATIPQSAAPRELTAAPQKMNLGQARALMIVGGAAILAGAIIGDDAGGIIMVGGAVIGLIGLYEYLQ